MRLPCPTPAIGNHPGAVDWRSIVTSTVSTRIRDAAAEAERNQDCGEWKQHPWTKENWHLTVSCGLG
jgi:hypothetical protein